MSGWKLVTRELHEAGRPMQRQEFSHAADGSDPYKGLRDAKALGMVRAVKRKYQWLWEITEQGREWAEGRLEVVYLKPMKQGGKRTPAATWLAQLPKTNEVRIC